MGKLTPDALILLAGQLEDLAGTIAGFPKYIRRDCGSKGINATVADLLRKHGLEDNTALADDILDLTEKLRLTIRNYYEGKFLDDLPPAEAPF